MPVTLTTAKVIVTVIAALSSGLDLGSVRDEINRKVQQVFSDGAGADQANAVFHDRRTLAASGTESLDLAGSLVDGLGRALTFTKIKAVIVIASDGNTNNVQVTRPAANGLPIFLAAGDGLALTPGGIFVFVDPSAAGVTVTAGTGDLFTLTNSAAGTGVTYDVIIIGTV